MQEDISMILLSVSGPRHIRFCFPFYQVGPAIITNLTVFALMKSPHIISIPGFTLTFRRSKC